MNRRARRQMTAVFKKVFSIAKQVVRGMRSASADAAWLLEKHVEKYSKAEDSGWRQ